MALCVAEWPNILFFLVDFMCIGKTSVPFLYKDGEVRKIGLNNFYPHSHCNTFFYIPAKNWKITYNYESETWELYNLKDDPFEK